MAHIVVLSGREISKNVGCGHGIAAQSIMLGVTEKGLGGCTIGSIKREALRETPKIPQQYEIVLVLALCKPAETVVLEDVGPDASIKDYRGERDVHHVPKRTMLELILCAHYG